MSCQNNPDGFDNSTAHSDMLNYKISDSIVLPCLNITLDIYTSIEVRDKLGGGVLVAKASDNNLYEIFTGSKIRSSDSMVVDPITFFEFEQLLNNKTQMNEHFINDCVHELKSILDAYIVSRYNLAYDSISSSIKLIAGSDFNTLTIPVKLPSNCELSACAEYRYKSELIYLYSYTKKQSLGHSDSQIWHTNALYIYNPRYKFF